MMMVGIGCRAETNADAVIALVREAVARWGMPDALAVPPFRKNHPGVRAAAKALSLPVRVVDFLALASAQPRCLTHSERARRAVGFGSIAEGCALAALGPAARLLGPRLAAEGVTCAFARTTATAKDSLTAYFKKTGRSR
ncbi:cobalamin biosynthesis protein [Kozakia baliensis]|uniref:cobalamin biosynthesis protein n=1 Tax=Kozakia baliensis TaxID=153496 RepID=UPI00089DAFA2|nr:cobalamin biosynthesis protein [Kozakia baliensis]